MNLKHERQLKAAQRLKAALADPEHQWKTEQGSARARKSLEDLAKKLPSEINAQDVREKPQVAR